MDYKYDQMNVSDFWTDSSVNTYSSRVLFIKTIPFLPFLKSMADPGDYFEVTVRVLVTIWTLQIQLALRLSKNTEG